MALAPKNADLSFLFQMPTARSGRPPRTPALAEERSPFVAPPESVGGESIFRTLAKHLTDIVTVDWPAPHFPPGELACHGTGMVYAHPKLLRCLEQLRRDLDGKPLIVLSAYRSPEHNARVGGAKNSYHMRGMAADISMANFRSVSEIEDFCEKAFKAGFNAVVGYPNSNFVHIDIGPARTWKTPGRWKRADTGEVFDVDGRIDKRRRDATGNVVATAAAGAGVKVAVEGADVIADPAMLEAVNLAQRAVDAGLVVIVLGIAGFLVWRFGREAREWLRSRFS